MSSRTPRLGLPLTFSGMIQMRQSLRQAMLLIDAFGGGPGATRFVDPENGDDDNLGKSWNEPKATLTDALLNSAADGIVFMAPGEYDEAVVLSPALSNVTLVGIGGRGSAFIAPSAANADALTIKGDDVTLINVGAEGNGTGGGLVNYGRRTRGSGCKFEGGANAVKLSLGTVAQIAAETFGKGDDTLFEDCEIAWSTNGVKLIGSDYGAVTQAFFKRCYFHGLTASSFEEAHGAGGAVTLHYRGLLIDECTFGMGDEETDALPTKWLSLNDDNANSGIVSRCVFPAAINSGKNLVSTALRWIGNVHTGGIAAAQPS
jgi:hypothetical protein